MVGMKLLKWDNKTTGSTEEQQRIVTEELTQLRPTRRMVVLLPPSYMVFI